MPLKVNVPTGRKNWKLTKCPECGAQCWELPLAEVAKWLLIGMLWQGLELWFYGTTRPSNEDTIIGFFLWYYIVRCEYMKRGVWWKRGGDNGKR